MLVIEVTKRRIIINGLIAARAVSLRVGFPATTPATVGLNE